MGSNSCDVCELIGTFVPKVLHSTVATNSQEVCTALYGMQGVSSNRPEAKAMLMALEKNIVTCNDLFLAQGVCTLIYTI